jgi:hypothetical protein
MAVPFQQAQTARYVERRKLVQAAQDLYVDAPALLKALEGITVLDMPLLDLITLHPDLLPDITRGSKKKIGSDGHLLSAMQKILGGLADIKSAMGHPRMLAVVAWQLSRGLADIKSAPGAIVAYKPPTVNPPLGPGFGPPTKKPQSYREPSRRFIDIADMMKPSQATNMVSQGAAVLSGVLALSIVMLTDCLVWLLIVGLSTCVFVLVHPDQVWIDSFMYSINAVLSYMNDAVQGMTQRWYLKVVGLFTRPFLKTPRIKKTRKAEGPM